LFTVVVVVMMNSGKNSKLIVIQSNPLDVGHEMSADIDMRILTVVIVGRLSHPTALAVISHHKIII